MTTVTEALESVLLLIEGDFRHKFAPRLKNGKLCTIVLEDYINETEARISELVEQNDSLKRRLSMAWERGEFALLTERDALRALLKEAGEALAPLAQQITNLGDCVEGCMRVQDDVTIKMLTSSTSIRKAAAIADKIKEQLK